MRVNIAISPHNSADWPRVMSGRFDQPMERDDPTVIDNVLAIGDLAEPLGYDGIWVPDHFGSPYSMSPNPLQVLAYFAGRTERIHFGTMVLVLPWWHPIRVAHQIAYLDIISKGRYDTIGVGRGIAKTEFDAMGIARDETRTRFSECLDILELALSGERFSYEGEIYKIPETSIRPQPRSKDLFSRILGASATHLSLEGIARRGLRPLFIGNKGIKESGKDVLAVNRIRQEVGLPPCQPKNIQFMYCTKTEAEAEKAQAYIQIANRDVNCHYRFDDLAQFEGIKGYEAYAAGIAAASAATTNEHGGIGGDSYDTSNLLVGTPDKIIEQIIAGQKTCSYSEFAILPTFGGMPFEDAEASVRLFAQEVLPTVHRMDAPLHASCIPEPALAPA
jgi:alkanesulfonate monooxygenase SsuD/methylene tetrahydromethanopterin reductase-like flavin-dependent oxidoreductase (luciferase family)